jgi:hypothetical protein
MTKLLPDPKKSFRIYKQIRIKDKRIKTYIRKMGCKSLKYTFMKTRFCVNGGEGGSIYWKIPSPLHLGEGASAEVICGKSEKGEQEKRENV